MMNFWNGAGVAIVTPFKDGAIDYPAMEALHNWQIAEGTDALIIAGTTGESATLSHAEKLELFAFAIKVVGGRVPVIAGTGNNNTADSITLSVEAEKLGADGLLLVTPYYNKPSQRGLYAHYQAIADAVTIPCILYNVPGRTSVDLLPETVIELAKVPNIRALKEASGHPERCGQIKAQVPADFFIYSGNDGEIFDFMAQGGNGVISVLSNVAPRATHDIVQKYVDGDVEGSRALQAEYDQLIDHLFIETNPVPVKEALNLMGRNAGEFRLPLVGLAPENRAILTSTLVQYGLIPGGEA